MNKKFDSTIGATFTGILDAFSSSAGDLHFKGDENLEGKTILITGSSSGLGFATAERLAKKGARLIMAVRSGIPEKGELIKKQSGNSEVEMEYVDLSDFKSIQTMVLGLKERKVLLNQVIFNAGMFPVSPRSSVDGLDLMFKVNYLSSFLLVHLLFEHQCLKLNTKDKARLIFVSSESHRSFSEAIQLEDFGRYQPYKASKVIKYYGYYKLLLNAFIVELNQRIRDRGLPIQVHAMCPGAVNTNIAREAPFWLKPIISLMFKLFFQSPQKASLPLEFLSTSKEMDQEESLYLHMRKFKAMSDASYDLNNRKNVWLASQALLIEMGIQCPEI